jgi:hypothetical protein
MRHHAAARFLGPATVGAAPLALAALQSKGQAAWLARQFAMPASPMPLSNDMTLRRNNW